MSEESNKLADQAVPESDSPAVVEERAVLPAEEGESAEAEVAAEVTDAELDEEVVVEDATPAEEVEVEGVAEETAVVAEADDSSEDDSPKMDWYILKVQSNRERSIAEALRRKIAIEGLDEFFGEVIVPMEKVTEFKGGKKKVVQRKLYPGYIVVNMLINDDTWFAVRETSGIGDFTGAHGKPSPMLPHEVTRIIQTEEEETDDAPKLNIAFKLGDRVKIKEGTFESFEGEVNEIDEHSGRVTVMINIFGRSTPVELEYWQAEQL